MRVLIAGYGFVGEALGERLLARGDEVFGLRRSFAPGKGSKAKPFRRVAADLLDSSTLVGLPEVDAIVYAASPCGRNAMAYSAIYGDGFSNLIEAYRGGKGGNVPGRVIFVSSTSVYGQGGDVAIDESTPIEPKTETARTLAEAEERARQRVPSLSILRLSGIYGPGRTHLIRTVMNGEIPAHDPLTNRIHREDAAQAIERIIDVASPAPLYLGVDDEPARLSEVRAFIASELCRLGHPPPPPSVPSAIRAMSGSKRIQNRALRSIGFSPRYPSYREGYPAIVAGYLASIAR
ncbi:MAG: NAD-dependent epimerase/dehydratase family protein [Sandaracinaceae bacterium]|nr:NAD-dependent epimerase/dehydratase family protein [Sandaracinaceae bacterium]